MSDEEAMEGRRRSLAGNACITAIAVLLVVLPEASWAAPWLSGFSLPERGRMVGAAWLVFELACVAHWALGPNSRTFRALDAIDDAAQQLVLLTLIYASRAVASPLWLLVLFVSRLQVPRTQQILRRQLVLLFVGHTGLAVAFAASGHRAAATATIVMMTIGALNSLVARHLLAQSLLVRAERDTVKERLATELAEHDRDRVARDLHDGVGADVVALLLRLRHRAEATALTARAQRTLEALRNAVRILRRGRVSLAALAQVIGGAVKQAERDQDVDANVAIATVAVARAVNEAASIRGVDRQLSITTDGDGAIRLLVEHAGEALSPADAALAPAAQLLEEHGGELVCAPGRIEASIPLDPPRLPS